MTRDEFYKLTDILNTEVLGYFMHGGEADELIAMFEEAVEHSNILEQEEPVSEELEEAADQYSQSIHSDYSNDMFDRGDIYEAVIYGAEWQKEQMMKSVLEVADERKEEEV